jgi:TonB family protein
MIGSWAVYVLLVSAVVSVAAWVGERGARAQRWATRWVWAAALGVSVAVPLATWLLPLDAASAPIAAVPGSYLMSTLPPLTLTPADASTISPVTLLLSAWAVVTSLLLVVLLVLGVRLARRRRRWSPRMVDGVEVLVSRRTGPAALGVLRGRVVLPEWALSLAENRRRLLVMHEAEHVRAGDPRLAFLGLLLCALAPWNLPLWWQLRRLRLAIEVDCDARVLRRTGDARSYGSLLVEVGQRRTRLALALAEPRTMLERRIRIITATTRRATLRAVGLATVAGLLLAVACETPGPTERTPTDLESTQTRVPTVEDVEAEPVFTPMTVSPQLKNVEAVQESLRELYPPLLRQAGINGTANVWLLIDTEGGVRRAQINRPSGYEALDQAALRVARQMEFTPAYNRDRRVPVWVALDVTFETEVGEEAAGVQPPPTTAEQRALAAPRQEEAAAREISEAEEMAGEPIFTPMTERPRLRNGTEVSDQLMAHYPPLLKDAGIGGTVNVWFFIDETGTVQQVRVNRGSGYPAMDEAALEVARLMEFTPAMNRDQPVRVWVALDISFGVE